MVAMTSGGTGEEGGGKTGKTAVGTPRRADSVCARGGGRPASRQVMGECGSGRGGGRHPPPAGGCPPLEWERRWGDTEGRRGEGTADVVGRGGPGGDGGATAAAVRPTAGRRRDGARPPVGGRRGGRYAPRRPTQRLAAPPSDVDRQRRTHPQPSSAARNENQKKRARTRGWHSADAVSVGGVSSVGVWAGIGRQRACARHSAPKMWCIRWSNRVTRWGGLPNTKCWFTQMDAWPSDGDRRSPAAAAAADEVCLRHRSHRHLPWDAGIIHGSPPPHPSREGVWVLAPPLSISKQLVRAQPSQPSRKKKRKQDRTTKKERRTTAGRPVPRASPPTLAPPPTSPPTRLRHSTSNGSSAAPPAPQSQWRAGGAPRPRTHSRGAHQG